MRASARPMHWALRSAVIALTSFALVASLINAAPAYAATPPTEVTAATNLSTVAAGQTYRVTATTSSTVSATGSRIEILKVGSDDILATCTTGSSCSFSSTFPSGDARSYAARVVLESNGTVLAESAPVMVSRQPWAVDLASSSTTLQAGQTARLTATTNQHLDRTEGAFALYIFDRTSETLLGTCTTGKSCIVNVTGYAGSSPELEYVAAVAAAGAPGKIEDATDIQALSTAVAVARSPWSVALSSSRDVVLAGQTVVLTATSNQNVGGTEGRYALYIVDTSRGVVLKTCATGRTCQVTAESMYATEQDGADFTAFVAKAGAGTYAADLEDVQAASESRIVTRSPWELSLTADASEVVAGQTVRVSLAANQDVAKTSGRYALYIFDARSDTLLKKCTSGMTCAVSVPWENLPDYGGYVFLGFVAADGDAQHVNDLVDVRMSEYLQVGEQEWEATISADRTIAGAGDKVTVTATTSQNLSKVDGRYALYIIDAVDMDIVKICTRGTNCTFSEEMYSPRVGDWVPTVYWAWVAYYVPGATNWGQVNDGFKASAGGFEVERQQWEISLERVNDQVFEVRINQDVAKTHRRLTVYLYAGDEYAGSCTSSTRCLIRPSIVRSDVGYSAFVLGRETPKTNKHEDPMHLVQAGAAWTPPPPPPAPTVTPPPPGPTKPDETTGGSNPAEPNCQCSHADPVNTATGEFFENLVDLQLPGVGPALTLARGYSSLKASEAGPFGYGWSGNFGMRLESVTPDERGGLPLEVRVVQENGSAVYFARDDKNKYYGPDRAQATLLHQSGETTWVFTRNGAETISFAEDGNLRAVADRFGNTISFTQTSGHITEIIGSGGRSFLLTWDDNRIARVTDSAGRQVEYRYLDGELVSVTSADGTTSYQYDSLHRLTRVTVPGGATTTNVFDESGRAVSQTDPLGRVTSFAYGEDGVSRITHPDGTATEELYLNGLLISQTKAAGTDDAATTLYSYDWSNNIIDVTDPLGNSSGYDWDTAGNKIAEIDSYGSRQTWAYNSKRQPLKSTDPLGRTTTFKYDTAGNLTSLREPNGSTKYFTYNADGTMATSTDDAEQVTTYAYDARGLLTSTTSPSGLTTQIQYDLAGVTISTSDPVSGTTTFAVDSAGRMIASTDSAGYTTAFSYDSAGNRVSMTDALGASTIAQYDRARQLVASTDAMGRTTTYVYDAIGRVTSVTRPGGATSQAEYDLRGNLVAATDADGRTTRFEYDLADRLIKSTTPRGSATLTDYDASDRAIRVTDAGSNATTYSYNLAGELLDSTDPLGRVTSYVYTSRGQLAETHLPDGSIEKTTYDKAGRPLTFVDADRKKVSYSYTSDGKLASRTEPGGLVTGYSYDSRGLTAIVAQPDGTTQKFEYDGLGRVIEIVTGSDAPVTHSYDAVGRLVSTTDSTGTSTKVHDALGRVTESTDGGGATLRYAYDEAGNPVSLTYPDGNFVEYAYSNAGLITGLDDGTGGSFEFRWDADGNLTSTVYPNGLVQESEYDAVGAATSIAILEAATPVASFGYTYDAAHQITNETTTDLTGAWSSTYTYTALNQLDVASRSDGVDSTTAVYRPTSGGINASSTAGDALAYNAASQLTRATSLAGVRTNFSYDGNGARVTSKVNGNASLDRSYTYDDRNVLVSAAVGASTVSYTSDANGLRQTRSFDGVTTDFVWSSVGSVPLLLAEGDRSYIYGPGLTPLEQVDNTGTFYLHADRQGSVRAVSNTDGDIVSSVLYDAYGTVARTVGTMATPFGYTGNWTDSLTGHLYLRARDYDPTVGQFLTVDPAIAETHDAYGYARQNPIRFTDPLGLDFWSDTWDNVVAGAAGVADTLTGGLSSMFLSAVVPGYDCFIEENQTAFSVGQVVGTVIEVVAAVVTIVATAGTGTALVAAATMGRAALKAGIKMTTTAIKTAATTATKKATGNALSKTTRQAGENATVGSQARFVGNSAGDILDTARVTVPPGKPGYLLNNPSKSGIFKDRMGFDESTMPEALRNHLSSNFGNASGSTPMVDGVGSMIGTKFTVGGQMAGPGGRTFEITTAWGVDHGGAIRFLTAFPTR